MRIFKQALAALGGIVALAAVVLLTSPNAVHALTATLVQVTNTIGNPVPTADVARSVSQNVELFCNFSPTNVGSCGQVNGGCFADYPLPPCPQYSVPSNQSLVVDTVEVTQNSASAVFVDLEAADLSLITFTNVGSYGVPGNNVTTQYQYPVAGLVIGPGLQPQVFVHTLVSISGFMIVVGHLRAN